jgi:TetR/AcrR family transcriptional repressor of nem operon
MEQTKGQETRSHILMESRRLFTLRGFQNSSISSIISATGVKKGNLYYHFPSKEELGLAVLIDARDEFYTILDDSLRGGGDPVKRVLHSCQVVMDLMQQSNFVGGCLFGNTALEMTDMSSRFGQIIREVFSHWIKLIADELYLAQEEGQLQSSLPAEKLAISIVAILEGGIMLSRVYLNKESLEVCIFTIRELLARKE